MAKYFNEFIETVKRNLSEPPGFGEEIYEDAVTQAVRIYSRYRPRTVVTDITGSSAGDFDLTLPSTFIDGFSTISSVEFPFDPTESSISILKESEFKLYRSPSGIKLRLFNAKVYSADTARVAFTSNHSVTISSSTIPENHEDAISNLSSSIVAEIVAVEFAHVSRSSLDDIAINFKQKSEEWQIISDRYMLLFRKDLGIKDNDLEPLVGWTDLDSSYQFGGIDFLTHPRRWR